MFSLFHILSENAWREAPEILAERTMHGAFVGRWSAHWKRFGSRWVGVGMWLGLGSLEGRPAQNAPRPRPPTHRCMPAGSLRHVTPCHATSRHVAASRLPEFSFFLSFRSSRPFRRFPRRARQARRARPARRERGVPLRPLLDEFQSMSFITFSEDQSPAMVLPPFSLLPSPLQFSFGGIPELGAANHRGPRHEHSDSAKFCRLNSPILLLLVLPGKGKNVAKSTSDTRLR
jgi:hypothetical protein